jgi:hypothetical protein
MKQSAAKVAGEEPDAIPQARISLEIAPGSNVISYPPVVGATFRAAVDFQAKQSRRAQRLRTFIKLELTAFAVLLLFLFAATSGTLNRLGLGAPLKLGVAAAAFAVALIPALFYGTVRQKYRYRRYKKSRH